jgi:hypothetical protein
MFVVPFKRHLRQWAVIIVDVDQSDLYATLIFNHLQI